MMTATRSLQIVFLATALLLPRVADAQFVEQTPTLTIDASLWDHLGTDVAVDGDTAILGATHTFGYGTAWIFSKNAAGGWTETAKLKPSVSGQFTHFGASVSISGDYAIVGAMEDSEVASQIPTYTGAAYVYARNQGGPNAWGEVARLVGSDVVPADRFGVSVSIHGSWAIVGSLHDWNSRLPGEGAAYVFHRDDASGVWGQTAKLIASDSAIGNRFGRAVALSDRTALIGSGGFNNPVGGVVYVFSRDGAGNWTEIQKLIPTDSRPNDQFGAQVAIHARTAIIAAANAAYIFDFNRKAAVKWSQTTKLESDDSALNFGVDVAIHGDAAMVGATSFRNGAAYVFYRHGDAPNAWGQVAKLIAGDLATRSNAGLFGYSVFYSEGDALVGAPQQSGIIRNPDGTVSEESGTVYLFRAPQDPIDMMQSLITVVNGIDDLSYRAARRLTQLLKLASAPALFGQPNYQITALRTFIDEVRELRRKQLDDETADDLIDRARDIIKALR